MSIFHVEGVIVATQLTVMSDAYHSTTAKAISRLDPNMQAHYHSSKFIILPNVEAKRSVLICPRLKHYRDITILKSQQCMN